MDVGSHDIRIRSICCNSNGTMIASGDDKGIVKVWAIKISPTSEYAADEMVQLKVQNSLTAHSGPVNDLAFIGECVLASCGNDNAVRLWNIAERALLHTLVTDSADMMSILPLSPVGSDGLKVPFIAGGNANGTLYLWNSDSGHLELLQDYAKTPITSMATSPSGKYIAYVAEDGVLRVSAYTAADNRYVLVKEVSIPSTKLTSVCINNDELILAGTDTCSSFYIWDGRDTSNVVQVHPPVVDASEGSGEGEGQVTDHAEVIDNDDVESGADEELFDDDYEGVVEGEEKDNDEANTLMEEGTNSGDEDWNISTHGREASPLDDEMETPLPTPFPTQAAISLTASTKGASNNHGINPPSSTLSSVRSSAELEPASSIPLPFKADRPKPAAAKEIIFNPQSSYSGRTVKAPPRESGNDNRTLSPEPVPTTVLAHDKFANPNRVKYYTAQINRTSEGANLESDGPSLHGPVLGASALLNARIRKVEGEKFIPKTKVTISENDENDYVKYKDAMHYQNLVPVVCDNVAVRKVKKQVDNQWVASLSQKPLIESLLLPSLQPVSTVNTKGYLRPDMNVTLTDTQSSTVMYNRFQFSGYI
jgi:WD40 repeat protein